MLQQDLFPSAKKQTPIPGLTLLEEYISCEQEHALLSYIESGPWDTDWRRRIQQYGFGYAGAHGGTPTWLRDFPEWLRSLAERVAVDGRFERVPDNCVINEYIPPLGIGPHRDYPAFGPRIACVSLGSDIVTDFTNPRSDQRVSVYVPARSFWVITDEARSIWMHGIASRLTDVINNERRPRSRRVSITFRTTNQAAA